MFLVQISIKRELAGAFFLISDFVIIPNWLFSLHMIIFPILEISRFSQVKYGWHEMSDIQSPLQPLLGSLRNALHDDPNNGCE